MKSQYGRAPQSFDYGPFLNHSTATLTITLHQVGKSSHRFARSTVNGIPTANGGSTVTFTVPPGSSYTMSVKDSYAITAYADQNNLMPADVGLPSASDFNQPTGGEYLGCRTWINGTDPLTGETTLYYYKSGTRSDKSSRNDSNRPPEPPVSIGHCEVIDAAGGGGD